MPTSINVKFMIDSACLSATLGDNQFFRCANNICYLENIILQIADVICQVAFLLFLPCFQPIVHLFLTLETSEMFAILKSQPKQLNLVPWSTWLTVFYNLHFSRHQFSIAKFFHIWTTIVGYNKLCMRFQPIRNKRIFNN